MNLGLNHPLYYQYLSYLKQFLGGNWGTDLNGVPVLTQISNTFPATLELVFASLFLMVIIGIPLGVVAARYSGRWPDHLVRVLYLSGWATPTYLAGFLLVYLAAPFLGLPTSGQLSGGGTPTFATHTKMYVLDALIDGNFPAFWDASAHLLLPALALAFVNLGIATRMTRASMLEVLPLDYVKTARMKGLSEQRVIYRHALRNSLITTTTVLGVTAGGLLSGTVVVESIFRWQGMGQFAFSSIQNADFASVLGTAVLFAVGVVIANLAADILYGYLDPRVEWR